VAAGLSVEPGRWLGQFEDLMGRVAGRFARVEPRRLARAFVLGLLSGLRRKNCRTLAEQAGDAASDGMQHLLAGAVWDADAVRDDVRSYVVEHLCDPGAVLVVRDQAEACPPQSRSSTAALSEQEARIDGTSRINVGR
jgi:SRSO17 transposase